MFFSLAIILLFGLLLCGICKKLRLPSLIGMLAVGIIIGPYALNLIDRSILEISAQLRKIALIIILARAGLSLNVSELKKVGRPAIMMCFVPACFEIIGMILLAPKLLGMSVVDAAVMGTVVGAVSPAVIVPKIVGIVLGNFFAKAHIRDTVKIIILMCVSFCLLHLKILTVELCRFHRLLPLCA